MTQLVLCEVPRLEWRPDPNIVSEDTFKRWVRSAAIERERRRSRIT